MRAILLFFALGVVTVVGCASSSGGSARMAPNMMGQSSTSHKAGMACGCGAKPTNVANHAQSMTR
ncbi:MAG: hypothetical protein U1D30_07195 [Planctomycetota bacterium]